MPPDPAPRVFISYSHDSGRLKDQVRGLADQLRRDGVDCEIDQYVESPPEGWPSWMLSEVGKANFVIVVSTAMYRDRFEGIAITGRGRGARWEGAIITQALYESEGRNEKFLPVVFESSDLGHIPSVLRGVTYYDLSANDGYEPLYRRVTSQPRIERPPLGAFRPMPATSAAERTVGSPEGSATASADLARLGLLLTFGQEGKTILAEMDRYEATQDRITVTLLPDDGSISSALTRLQTERDVLVGVAVGLTTKIGRLREVVQAFVDGRERWTVTLAAVPFRDVVDTFMELSLANLSADQIAELRLRRLLLNESPSTVSPTHNPLDGTFLEVLVAGMNVPLSVEHSPFPVIFKEYRTHEAFFLAAARLVGALWAVLSGAVETVERLDLAIQANQTLHVNFAGRRARKFVNEEPVRLAVEGNCQLVP